MHQATRLYFPLLDPLRGFAAISVLVYHVIELCHWQNFPKTGILGWFKWGWMGVDIFFVISGFVISLTAWNTFKKFKNNHLLTIKDFLGRRVRRIVPLFYLSILFFLILTPEIINTNNFSANISSHLLFIHNWFSEFHRSINAPSWTLGDEFQFYVLIILLIPFINKNNLLFILSGSILLSLLWRTLGFYYNYDGNNTNTEFVFIWVTQLPGMIEFFTFGMVLAFFVRTKTFNNIKILWKFRILLLLIICLLGYLSMTTFISHEKDFWYTAHAVIFLRTLLAVWFATVLLFLCTFEPSAKCRKLLAPLTYLGTISYGIYLFHWPILLQIKDFNIAPIAKLILVVASTVSLAALSWHFFEKRFLKKFK